MVSATRMRRLIAVLIDLLTIYLLIIFILKSIYKNSFEIIVFKSMIRSLAGLGLFIFSLILEATNQKGSIGYKLLRIKVVNENGDRITFGQSLKRNLLYLIFSGIILESTFFILGLLNIIDPFFFLNFFFEYLILQGLFIILSITCFVFYLINKDKKTWYDILSKTRVVNY
jgi:uncharacterized RDD family membrane protein YckC